MATAPRASMARKMRERPPVTGEHVRKLTPQRYTQSRLATLANGRNDGCALVVRLLALMEQAPNLATAARYAVAVDADASTVVLALVGVPGAFSRARMHDPRAPLPIHRQTLIPVNEPTRRPSGPPTPRASRTHPLPFTLSPFRSQQSGTCTAAAQRL